MKTETLLLEMRSEQRQDHAEIVKTVNEGFAHAAAAMAAHALEDARAFGNIDKRLGPVEEARKVYRNTALALTLALIPLLLSNGCSLAKALTP